MSGPLHNALAELVLVYSQQHAPTWPTSDIELVQRCKAVLEQSDAMERQDFSEAQQEAQREEREAGREGRQRDPQEDWERGPRYPRR